MFSRKSLILGTLLSLTIPQDAEAVIGVQFPIDWDQNMTYVGLNYDNMLGLSLSVAMGIQEDVEFGDMMFGLNGPFISGDISMQKKGYAINGGKQWYWDDLEMFGVRHGIQFMNAGGEKMMGYTSAGTLTPPGDDRTYGVSYSVSWLRPRGENFWDKDYRVLNASAGAGRLDIR